MGSLNLGAFSCGGRVVGYSASHIYAAVVSFPGAGGLQETDRAGKACIVSCDVGGESRHDRLSLPLPPSILCVKEQANKNKSLEIRPQDHRVSSEVSILSSIEEMAAILYAS